MGPWGTYWRGVEQRERLGEVMPEILNWPAKRRDLLACYLGLEPWMAAVAGDPDQPNGVRRAARVLQHFYVKEQPTLKQHGHQTRRDLELVPTPVKAGEVLDAGWIEARRAEVDHLLEQATERAAGGREKHVVKVRRVLRREVFALDRAAIRLARSRVGGGDDL